jgi:hypothetical protein
MGTVDVPEFNLFDNENKIHTRPRPHQNLVIHLLKNR